MRLYHFTKLETALKFILPHRQLKVGRFENLNDPFELWGVQGGNESSRELLASVKDQWWNAMGVMCFGKHWKSPVMWAHYGDSHKGVALGFDVPDDKPREMKYENEPRTWTADRSAPALGATEELFKDLVTTKFRSWSYEEECRLFVRLENVEDGEDCFYQFNSEFRLKEIILGAECKESMDSFFKVLRGHGELVSLVRAKPDFARYSMVPDSGFAYTIAGSDLLCNQGSSRS